MNYESLFAVLQGAIQSQEGPIIALGRELFATPELGFHEHRTQARAVAELEKLGLTCTTYPDTTGFYADIDTGREGPCVLLFGEMDALICREHPAADPITGAAHACGHHVQLTSVVGAAYALLQSGVLAYLCGKIRLMGVPAEELIDLEWRFREVEAGRLHFTGGKAELLYRGAFDGVDVVLGLHAADLCPRTEIETGTSYNGFVAKSVRFRGRSSHAAGSPWDGHNALYAAAIALCSLNALRETFRDSDHIRIHPIMTKGGDVVNAIPEDTRLEILVRGATMEAVFDAAEKCNRAMHAGALALNCVAEITTKPGYFAYQVPPTLNSLAHQVGGCVVGEENVVDRHRHSAGSADLADLATLMPAIQPCIGPGFNDHHSKEYRIDESVYTNGSLYLAALATRLLWDGGKAARACMDSFTPMFATKEAYFDYCRSLSTHITLQ